MALIKGTSDSVLKENIRTLRQQGWSEAQATQKARAYATQAGPTTDREGPEDVGAPTTPARQFVVVTRDMSGLGYAALLARDGETVTLATDCPEDAPDDVEAYERVGEGMGFEILDLPTAMKQKTSPTTYWIFAENNCPKEADQLRKKGAYVFGTSAFQDQMEHDRQYAVDVMTKAGLHSPETEEFTDRDAGLQFLDAHPDTAYVLKPDGSVGNHLTFVPVRVDDADANRETYTYLQNLAEEPERFILQERVQGTEFNVEVWYYEGLPFFAFMTLEAKRKDNGDLGEMAGCAGDLVWVLDLNAPLLVKTLNKLEPFYKSKRYTGFADVNCIWTEDRGPLFLEVCNRFGYNSHVSLLLGLLQTSLGDFFADFMTGKLVRDVEERFSGRYAASLTLFLDHPVDGLPVKIETDRYYPFDGRMDDDTFLLAGYSHEVGIVVEEGATPQAAMDAVLQAVQDEQVSFTNMHYRTDLGETGYPNAILDRYEALQDMGLLHE